MDEIEAKFKVDDLEGLRQGLEKIGATHQKTKEQEDTYFFHSRKNELKDKTTYLRIRVDGNTSKIAMHIPKNSYEWEELEDVVSSPDTIKSLFDRLGFEKDVQVKKKRDVFSVSSAEIVIDQVEGAGKFVEIEANSIERMKEICDELGLDHKNNKYQDVSYADLIRQNRSS